LCAALRATAPVPPPERRLGLGSAQLSSVVSFLLLTPLEYPPAQPACLPARLEVLVMVDLSIPFVLAVL